MFFTILVFLAAISLESLGSYISVVGLASKGSIILIITAISFDFAKVVIASVLYKKWHSIHFLLKSFLVPSLIGLVIFTSVGAYGFLIQEFTKTTIGQEQGRTLITSMEEERGKLQSRKEEIDGQIAALPANSVLQRKRLTAVFSKELDHINTRLISLDKEIPEAKVKVVADTNSSGTLGSIAKAYNVEPDLVIRLLAFFMVLMIDPLAIILLTIGNFLVEQRKKEKLMPKPVIKYVEEPVVEEESIFKKAMNSVKKKEVPVQETIVAEEIVNETMSVNNVEKAAESPLQTVLATKPVQTEQAASTINSIENITQEKSVNTILEQPIIKNEIAKKETIAIPKVETQSIGSISSFKRIPKKKKNNEVKIKAPVVEEIKAPVVEEIQAPVVEEIQAPVVEEIKAPVIEEVKAPVIEEIQAPVIEEIQAPVVAEVKAPVIEEIKAPVIEEIKAPVVEEIKAPVVEEIQAPVVAEVKAPVVAEVQVPVVAEVKAPVVEEIKAPVVAEVKAPVVAEVQVPVVEEIKAPVVEEVQAPVVEEIQVPVVAEIQAPVIEEIQAPVVAEVKAPVVAEVKAPVVAEVKAPVVAEVKAPVVENVKAVIKAPILPMVKPLFEKPKMLEKVAPITVSSKEEKNIHTLPKPAIKVSRTIEIPKPVLFEIKGGNIIRKPSVTISEQYTEQLIENEKKFTPSNLIEDKAINFDTDEAYWLDEEIIITEKDMIKGFETKNILDENLF